MIQEHLESVKVYSKIYDNNSNIAGVPIFLLFTVIK